MVLCQSFEYQSILFTEKLKQNSAVNSLNGDKYTLFNNYPNAFNIGIDIAIHNPNVL